MPILRKCRWRNRLRGSCRGRAKSRCSIQYRSQDAEARYKEALEVERAGAGQKGSGAGFHAHEEDELHCVRSTFVDYLWTPQYVARDSGTDCERRSASRASRMARLRWECCRRTSYIGSSLHSMERCATTDNC